MLAVIIDTHNHAGLPFTIIIVLGLVTGLINLAARWRRG